MLLLLFCLKEKGLPKLHANYSAHNDECATANFCILKIYNNTPFDEILKSILLIIDFRGRFLISQPYPLSNYNLNNPPMSKLLLYILLLFNDLLTTILSRSICLKTRAMNIHIMRQWRHPKSHILHLPYSLNEKFMLHT